MSGRREDPIEPSMSEIMGSVPVPPFSSDRLARLSERYSQCRPESLRPTLWSDEYVASDIPIATFRGDTAFVWQRRDGNTPASYLLAFLALRRHKETRELLDKFVEDGAFGAEVQLLGGRPQSRDTLDSAGEIDFIQRHCRKSTRPLALLDIGAGYGRLAHRVHEAGRPWSVISTDAIATSSAICEWYLRFRGVPLATHPVVAINEVGDVLRSRVVDVAVACHSFSECSREAVEWWLNQLASNAVEHLVVIPNSSRHQGKRLLSWEHNGDRLDLVPSIMSAGYEPLLVEPTYYFGELQSYAASPTHRHLFRFVGQVRCSSSQ